MKKKMRFMSLFLTAALILGALPGAAFAVNVEMSSQPDVWMLGKSNSGETYAYNPASGEKVLKAWGYNEDGDLVELDWGEYLKIKNSLPSASTEAPVSVYDEPLITNTDSVVADVSTAYEYRETMTYTQQGTPKKVTADVKGPASISYVNSVEISHTFGGEISVTGTIKNVIQLGASFDWHTTLMSGSSAGYTFNVPSGHTGYIQFTPYLHVTVGDLYYITIASGHYQESDLGEVWGKSPKMTSSGLADGLFELIY